MKSFRLGEGVLEKPADFLKVPQELAGSRTEEQKVASGTNSFADGDVAPRQQHVKPLDSGFEVSGYGFRPLAKQERAAGMRTPS